MPSKILSVGLKETSAVEDGIIVPADVAQLLGLMPGGVVNVGIGAIRRTAPLQIASDAHAILLGTRLAETASLSLPCRLKVKYEREQNLLRLGPFVAIFACRRRKAKSPSSRALFGARTLDVRQLFRRAKGLGICVYVMTPEGVKPGVESVVGYVIKGSRWAVRRFPIPDVVYDRIQARGLERRTSAREAKEFLQSYPHIRYFNDGFFDKWSIYERMASNPHIEPYLPPTEELLGSESLKAFLRAHSSVFIKPTEGSLGRGVFRVRRVGGAYELKRGGKTHRSSRFDSLAAQVARIQGRRRYIMQPDLHLATVGGSPFDVRILMQKDGQGVWRRTKTYARVAARGSLTSNLTRGGTGMGLGWVLRRRFGRKSRRIFARIRAAAFAIVRGLDDVMDGPLGEVGLDLGVNHRGRVWLIEVNSKPYRKVFTAGPKLGTFRSFQRPMAYARYLAEF